MTQKVDEWFNYTRDIEINDAEIWIAINVSNFDSSIFSIFMLLKKKSFNFSEEEK